MKGGIINSVTRLHLVGYFPTLLLVISKLRSCTDNCEHTVIDVGLHGLHVRPNFYFTYTPKIYETSTILFVAGNMSPDLVTQWI
jgi:hypothetical protein